MRKSIIITFAVFIALMAAETGAVTLDEAAARDLALHELNQSRPGRQLPPVSDVKLAHVEMSSTAADWADYYVFNASDGRAFVIVAGDDRAQAILGYGEGSLDMNSLPCGLQWLLDEYKQQMEWLYSHHDAQLGQVVAEVVNVEPMLASTWGQEAPYNNLCPTIDGSRCVTGCVATAMAQVMNYWKYPLKSPAIGSYMTSTEKLSVQALSKVNFDWDNMLNSYRTGYYNDAQADAVATLMRYCGQACKMDYGISRSSSWVGDQLDGMKLLKYNRDAVYVTRMDYSDDEWLALMLDELTNERPILYTGYGSLGSHAFVIDGYDGSKFHINWGWNGLANGFYAMGAFNAGGYTLNEAHQMIINLFPEPIELPYDFWADGIYYKLTSDSTVAVTCQDDDGNTYNGAVTIPSTVTYQANTYQVTSIADNAFGDCRDLTEVTIPSTVTSSGSNAFKNCRSLNRVNIDDLGAWCRIWFPTANANPLYYAHDLYLDGALLTDVHLPADVPAISHYAFVNSSIKRLDLGDGVETIGTCAFQYSSLEFLALGKSLKCVGSYAFVGCYNLKRVEIGNPLHWLSLEFPTVSSNPIAGSFNGTTNARMYSHGEPVMTFVIPDTVTVIKDYEFSGGGFPNLVIPPSVKKIGEGAFYYDHLIENVYIDDLSAWCQILFVDEKSSPASNLYIKGVLAEDIEIPESVTAIPDHAFYGCRSLKKVKTSSVQTIGNYAFSKSSITSFVSTASLRSIGKYAFSACDSMIEVIMPNTVTMLSFGTFEYCVNMKSVTLSNSLKRISTLAFSRCGLLSVKIPDSVTSIDEGAFYCCYHLKDVVIGARVEEIAVSGNTGAFNFCDSLVKITCRAAVPPVIRQKSFTAKTYQDATLYVPIQSLKAYQKADEWKKFAHIEGVEINMDLPGDVNADGSVNIADVNALINSIMNGDYIDNNDVNRDGTVNIADINMVINWILNN